MMSGFFLSLLFVVGLLGSSVLGFEKIEEKDIGDVSKNIIWEKKDIEEEIEEEKEYEENQLERIGNLLLQATSNWNEADQEMLDEIYDMAMKPCTDLDEPKRRKRQTAGCSVSCKKGSCSCSKCTRCYCAGWLKRRPKCEGFARPPPPPNGCSVTCKQGSCSCDTCNKCDCSKGLFNKRPYCYDALEDGCTATCRKNTVNCPNSKRCYCTFWGNGRCG